MVARVPRRLTRRGQRRREELVDFAARTFASKGYDATSIADIVEGLGVGKGVFYWYFESKEELFRQILVDAHRDLRRAQRFATGEEIDPIRRIEVGIRASVRWLDENRHLFALLEIARTKERFAPLVREGEERSVADALPHVIAGMEVEMIRRADPLVVAHAILGLTDHMARFLVLEGGKPAEEAADDIVSLCFEGIVTPATASRRLPRPR